MQSKIVLFSIKHIRSVENIFQQEICDFHRTKSNKAYMNATAFLNMKWPAQSSYLNPIENSWAILKRNLLQRPSFSSIASDFFLRITGRVDFKSRLNF